MTSPDGGVDFRMREMGQFLRQSSLPDMRNGHETIARICLRKLKEIGQEFVVKPWANFRQLLRRCSPLSLLDYVRRYWQWHYKEAESFENELPALLHQMIESTVMKRFLPPDGYFMIEVRHHVLNVGHQVCQCFGFSVLQRIYQQLGASTTNGFLSPPPCSYGSSVRALFRHSANHSREMYEQILWLLYPPNSERDADAGLSKPQYVVEALPRATMSGETPMPHHNELAEVMQGISKLHVEDDEPGDSALDSSSSTWELVELPTGSL